MSAALEGPALVAAVGAAALSVVAVSASGLWWLRAGPLRLNRRVVLLLALAIGALLGDAALHLLPHAVGAIGIVQAVVLALAGFGLFASVGALRRRRAQAASSDAPWSHRQVAMLLVVDALHHLLDGIVLAVAFAASPALGLATWIALVAHEAPKEWGELAALVAAGRPLRRALGLNLFAAAPLLIGAALGLWVGKDAHAALDWLGAVVAGGFLYLAIFLLLPTLRRLRRTASIPHRGPWLAGTAGALMMGALAAAEHGLGLDHGHLHGITSEERPAFVPYAPPHR